jgi:hypothetical protein
MGWIERKAIYYTPNRAIALLVIFSAYGGIGLMQIAHYFSVRDGFYLYAGIFNTLPSCLMVTFFVRVLQNAIRRLVAESKTGPPIAKPCPLVP